MFFHGQANIKKHKIVDLLSKSPTLPEFANVCTGQGIARPPWYSPAGAFTVRIGSHWFHDIYIYVYVYVYIYKYIYTNINMVFFMIFTQHVPAVKSDRS